MSGVVAIGALVEVQGYALAGARIVPADSAEEVRAAWQSLGADVAVVILTPAAAAALAEPAPDWPLSVVIPP